jgi:hypothetical protein
VSPKEATVDRTRRRAVLDVADVVLSLGLLVVAVVSASEARWSQSTLALVLAVAWSGAVALRHRRALRPAAVAAIDPAHAPTR